MGGTSGLSSQLKRNWTGLLPQVSLWRDRSSQTFVLHLNVGSQDCWLQRMVWLKKDDQICSCKITDGREVNYYKCVDKPLRCIS